MAGANTVRAGVPGLTTGRVAGVCQCGGNVALWLLDLDGVMWRGPEPIAGSAEAVGELLRRGDRVVFCTNHATSPEVKEERLRSAGVPPCPVVTSADAAATRCRDLGAVLVLGDATLVGHLRSSGLDATGAAEAAERGRAVSYGAVVVGANETWDRVLAGLAADAVRDGARFLATNDDPTFPTVGPAGPHLLPGNGALVAAVAVAAGRGAEVVGKPHAPMAEVIVDRHGPVDVVVGDVSSTDGALATALGARFGLVLSGVTARTALPVEPTPWRVADDLATLVDASADGGRR